MTEKTLRLVAPRRIEETGDVRFFAPPPGAHHVVLDLSRVEWTAPVGVVGLLALAHRAESDGLENLTIAAPEASEVRAFLREIGFIQAFETLGGNVDLEDRPEDTPAPIRPHLPATYIHRDFELDQAAANLEQILHELRAPGQTINAVYSIMAEMTNNGWEHGRSCYVTAQTHSGTNSGRPGIDLAIADLGPGFKQKLVTYGPESEVEAILLAFDDDVTSTGDPTRGFGLGWVLDAVDNYPGEAKLSIVSGDGMVIRTNGTFEAYAGPNCRGVFVTAYFPFR